MPQGRIVLKRICQSKKLAALKTDGARLLYTWLLPNVDVNGCFSADPSVLKGQIFTRLNHRVDVIENYLKDLEANLLIILYEVDGDEFLCIPDFAEKQPRLDPEKEGKPDILPPTQELIESYSRLIHEQGESNSPLSKVKQSKVKDKQIRESRGFLPPTFEEVKKYIADNPELLNVNAETFFKGFNDSGWIDTQGKPVRNWKLKLRTWSSYGQRSASKAGTGPYRRPVSQPPESKIGGVI
jgi:hypothetical protein